VVTDFQFSSVLDILIRQPAIPNQLPAFSQLQGPEAETEILVIPEIPIDPRPYSGRVGHLRVKTSGIRIRKYFEERSLIRRSVGAEAETFRAKDFSRHPELKTRIGQMETGDLDSTFDSHILPVVNVSFDVAKDGRFLIPCSNSAGMPRRRCSLTGRQV
jgi:hypothetical protein